jgi:purine-binding chemotaxis protein CheW
MQLCTYQLAGTWFGIDATKVQEVLRRQTVTPVPLAPAHVAGLLNIRGQIVTALDVHERMGFARTDREPLHIVVSTAHEPVSLMVDSIGGVVEVTDDEYEPAPPTTPAALRQLVSGAYKLPDRLVLVLDVEGAVA